MIVARDRQELARAVYHVEEKGKRLFGVPSFYVEKLLSGIKHIEFQILADQHGNVILLGERDCSIQRRFQKLIEEAPCQILSPHLRMKMGAAALDVAVALKICQRFDCGVLLPTAYPGVLLQRSQFSTAG
jgi:acetyl-CoA carboxylase biotin carboxylase subunit